ncbi:MAG: hypothetical protein DI599_05305 [Pseudomonas kuykendallii]|uniref:Uncharacterized protein n=1 Tax=Pseudomonas kuykendallii TaxID=1007099 RepID=A0A2W5D474_9PSED|nr:MAG: hypothetical protein DI599_05305 [Pseudomonas kuykendallii]
MSQRQRVRGQHLNLVDPSGLAPVVDDLQTLVGEQRIGLRMGCPGHQVGFGERGRNVDPVQVVGQMARGAAQPVAVAMQPPAPEVLEQTDGVGLQLDEAHTGRLLYRAAHFADRLAPRQIVQRDVVTVHEDQVGDFLAVLEEGVERVDAAGEETADTPGGRFRAGNQGLRGDRHRPIARKPTGERLHELALVGEELRRESARQAKVGIGGHRPKRGRGQQRFAIAGQRNVRSGEIDRVAPLAELQLIVDPAAARSARRQRSDLPGVGHVHILHAQSRVPRQPSTSRSHFER